MDGTVRIWDLRSAQGAVESFTAHGDSEGDKKRSKVLSLDWSRNAGLVGCAGELGVDVFRVNVGNNN